MATDDAQEAIVPVRGCLQTTQLKVPKWEAAKPLGRGPMLGGMGPAAKSESV